MIKAIKTKLLVAVALLAVAVTPMLVIGSVYAADSSITNNVKCGANLKLSDDGTGCTTNEGAGKISDFVTKAINFFSAVVGIISVVMIIWGGLKYVTSAGDSGNITAAKNTIMYAVIGLVVVAISQLIVQFVLEKVTAS